LLLLTGEPRRFALRFPADEHGVVKAAMIRRLAAPTIALLILPSNNPEATQSWSSSRTGVPPRVDILDHLLNHAEVIPMQG
jgi:hypothetical protein